MKSKELLQYRYFYNGEDNDPFKTKYSNSNSALWLCEKTCVEQFSDLISNEEVFRNYIESLLGKWCLFSAHELWQYYNEIIRTHSKE